MRTKIANHRAAVAARLAADDEWSKAGEPDNGPEWQAHNLAIAVQLWKGGGRGRHFPPAKVWAAQMAAAFKRIAAP